MNIRMKKTKRITKRINTLQGKRKKYQDNKGKECEKRRRRELPLPKCQSAWFLELIENELKVYL
jgi:hypothetical protein